MEKVIIYNDSVIEMALFTDPETTDIKRIGIRYLKPQNYLDKKGREISVANIMGGETDWFILPDTFSQVIGKKIYEQYNAGLTGFDYKSIDELKKWLIDFEIIDNAMTY